MKKIMYLSSLVLLVTIMQACGNGNKVTEAVVTKQYEKIREDLIDEVDDLLENSVYVEEKLEKLKNDSIIDEDLIDKFTEMKSELKVYKDDFGKTPVEDFINPSVDFLDKLNGYADLKADAFDAFELAKNIIAANNIEDKKIDKVVEEQNKSQNTVGEIYKKKKEDNIDKLEAPETPDNVADSIKKANEELERKLKEEQEKEKQRKIEGRKGTPYVYVVFKPEKNKKSTTIPFGNKNDDYRLKTERPKVKNHMKKQKLDVFVTFSFDATFFDEGKDIKIAYSNNAEMTGSTVKTTTITDKMNSFKIQLPKSDFEYGKTYFIDITYNGNRIIKNGKPIQIKMDILSKEK